MCNSPNRFSIATTYRPPTPRQIRVRLNSGIGTEGVGEGGWAVGVPGFEGVGMTQLKPVRWGLFREGRGHLLIVHPARILVGRRHLDRTLRRLPMHFGAHWVDTWWRRRRRRRRGRSRMAMMQR